MEHFTTTDKEALEIEMVRNRVHKIARFYTHLFIFIIGVLIYVAKTYFGAPLNFWPIKYINCAFMLVWTFIIAVQAIRLFFREFVFGRNWEEKKIQQILNKEKQTKWS